jgi:hypothetical protein
MPAATGKLIVCQGRAIRDLRAGVNELGDVAGESTIR